MEKNEAVFQYLVSPLQKLGLEEKLSYFSQICPPGLGAFLNQSIGQYLFSYVSAVNDKLHLNTDERPLPEFMKEHGAVREYLLKSVVGEDCFPHYMQQLEELRSKRCKEIMESTSRLYHFSQVPPDKFGTHLAPRLQVAGNALSERINEALCYAAADKESHYIVKPPSNERKEWDGVSVYMDEKAVLISGRQPKEFLDKQKPSYRYEVDKSTFKPNVSLDGRFTNEYESSENARVIGVDGPFSIIDMTASREEGGWGVPVYFLPDKTDKKAIYEKINELRAKGATRSVAMKRVSEQFPDKLIFFNENKDLLAYARNLEAKQRKNAGYGGASLTGGNGMDAAGRQNMEVGGQKTAGYDKARVTGGNGRDVAGRRTDMATFDEIIGSIGDEAMMRAYDGISLEDFGKPREDLDNRVMSCEEQRLNLAFYARAAQEHVGWSGFSAENRNGFKAAVETLYNNIDQPRRQGDFMAEVAQCTADFIEDRHFMLGMGGGKAFAGGGKKEERAVGSNFGYRKEMPDGMKILGEEYRTGRGGETYPLWKIGEMKSPAGEDLLVVSIPNLTDKNDYESWKGFIETFDKAYLENKDKWEKGRIILDVRGNGGGEDKPIDHVAKRLYGNLVNTYKRCEIKDTAVSNAFLHRHGAYKPRNYERDGLAAEKLVKRKNFSGEDKVLFDETAIYYPFNDKEGYHGRIDVLIDRGVGSSAESAYTSFYHHPNVRYVGENTAGMQQYTQGSFAMPCGYLMRVGVTKLTYWDKEGENIEVRGHKPDVDCRGKDAFEAVLQMPRDEGRILGFREKNEPVKGREVFAAYDPKAAADPRKAYYAKYLEPALARVEEENKLERNKVLAEAVDRKLKAKGSDGTGGENGRETEAAPEKRSRATAGISFRRREAAARAGKQGRE